MAWTVEEMEALGQARQAVEQLEVLTELLEEMEDELYEELFDDDGEITKVITSILSEKRDFIEKLEIQKMAEFNSENS